MLSWNGGKCPVDDNYIVKVNLRDGKVMIMSARKLFWGHFNEGGDIISYETI